jgi:hypothetical protein
LNFLSNVSFPWGSYIPTLVLLSMMVHIFNPSYSGNRGRGLHSEASLGKSMKNKLKKRKKGWRHGANV